MLTTILLLALLPLQDSGRKAVVPSEQELVGPYLRMAMREVLAFDRRLLDLEILDLHGAPSPPPVLEQSPEIVRFLLEGEPGLFPGRDGFNFGGRAPLFDQLLECGRHERGMAAAERLFARYPAITTEELLAPIDDEFLAADPIDGSERAQALHEFARAQARLAPLSNGCVAYVLWGFLNLDEYWQEKPGERESFISDLIERGANSQFCGMAVDRILQAPLLSAPDKAGRGVAYYLLDLRAKVGFTRKHRAQLEELVELVDAAFQPNQTGPNPFAKELETADREGEQAARTPSQLGHLRTWAPELLQWVLYELEPDEVDALMRRSENLESRKSYWTSLANTVPFAIYRELMLEEVRAMLDNLDEHPLSLKVAELEALMDSGVDTPELRRKLAELRGNLLLSRRELIAHIVELSVLSGADSDYRLMVTTLANDLHGLLQDESITIGRGQTANTPEQVLQGAWMRVGILKNPGALAVLDQVQSGEIPFPEYGTRWLINSILQNQYPGYLDTLENVVTTGTLSQRSSALLNSKWISAPRYAQEIDRLFADSRNASLSKSQRATAWNGAVHSLSVREGGDARALLLKSIRAGQWKGDAKQADWIHAGSFFTKWALEQLSSAEKSEFLQQGLLDPALLK